MRIWKRAAWRKKLLKSSSEFSAIQEDSLLRLGILFLSCLCDCGAGVSLLRERQGGFAVAPLTPSQCTLLFIGLYCCLGTKSTLTKKLPIQFN